MADEPRTRIAPEAAFFNMLRVTHSSREFFFEFGQTSIEPGIALMVGRLVTTPAHAKEILAVLEDNLRKYEDKFGDIAIVQGETKQ